MPVVRKMIKYWGFLCNTDVSKGASAKDNDLQQSLLLPPMETSLQLNSKTQGVGAEGHCGCKERQASKYTLSYSLIQGKKITKPNSQQSSEVMWNLYGNDYFWLLCASMRTQYILLEKNTVTTVQNLLLFE